MTNYPGWLRDFMKCLTAYPRELSARELAERIHDALVMAEAEKFATPASRFSFTLEGATDEDIADIRSHLTARENAMVEIWLLPHADSVRDAPMDLGRKCQLRQGIFGRWFIFHWIDPVLAWSGSEWTFCLTDGTPRGVQVCNFESEQEARQYCADHGLEPGP
jgi:hypothetical protein